jgi:DNA-binding response OmpR family regulator
MERIVKFLILDDQPEIREVILEIIQINLEESQVDEAENFDQAIELTNKTKYDILLVDINLVGKSGLEFVKEIRDNEGINKNTQIFIITGSPISLKDKVYKYDNILTFSKAEGIAELISNLSENLDN